MASAVHPLWSLQLQCQNLFSWQLPPPIWDIFQTLWTLNIQYHNYHINITSWSWKIPEISLPCVWRQLTFRGLNWNLPVCHKIGDEFKKLKVIECIRRINLPELPPQVLRSCHFLLNDCQMMNVFLLASWNKSVYSHFLLISKQHNMGIKIKP